MSEFVSPNRVALVEVARLLAPLLPEIAFVGGQVAGLLVTDPAATGIRPTYDVDVLVAATTRLEYYKIEKRLTALGLKHDMSEDSILCRWLTPGGHQIDVMPTEEGVLGFSNRWYPDRARAISRVPPGVRSDHPNPTSDSLFGDQMGRVRQS